MGKTENVTKVGNVVKCRKSVAGSLACTCMYTRVDGWRKPIREESDSLIWLCSSILSPATNVAWHPKHERWIRQCLAYLPIQTSSDLETEVYTSGKPLRSSLLHPHKLGLSIFPPSPPIIPFPLPLTNASLLIASSRCLLLSHATICAIHS